MADADVFENTVDHKACKYITQFNLNIVHNIAEIKLTFILYNICF